MKSNFLVLLKYEFLKFVKNPLQLFFTILLPVVLMILSGQTYGDNSNNGIKYINVAFPSFIMMVILVITINNVPLNIARSVQGKTLKHFGVLKIKKQTLILAMFVNGLVLFVLMFFLLLVLGKTVYHLDVDIKMFYLFLGSIFLLIGMFYFGITMVSFTKTFSVALSVSLIVLFVFLFTSGATIPSDVAGKWFTYVQKISPAGNGIIFMQQILNGTPITEDIFPIIYLSIFTVGIIPLTLKVFKYN